MFPLAVIQVFSNLFKFIIRQTVEEVQDDGGNTKGNAGVQGHSRFNAQEGHFALYGIGNVTRHYQDTGAYDSSQGLCDFTGEVKGCIGDAFFTDTVMPFTVVDNVGDKRPGNAVRNS